MDNKFKTNQMKANIPIQMPFGNGNISLDFNIAHYYVTHIVEAIQYFEGKKHKKSDLIMQIPLPLREVLTHIMAGPGDKIPAASVYDDVELFGVKCLPGYEARIVLYNPLGAFYERSPIAIIDFEVQSGLCQRPVFRVVE